MNNNNILQELYKKYDLSKNDIQTLDDIIYPIFMHEEFQIRMTSKFYHHGKITLGEHILEDAIVSYKLAKKSKKKVNIKLVVIMAMLHDLYTKPYQNVEKTKEKSFFNKHGFRHPIEAVINAYEWYPELFDNLDDTKVIVDGIVHHMYPFPVRTFYKDNTNEFDLNNYELLKKMPNRLIDMLIDSTHRKSIGNVSFSKSKYIEGRILSKADLIASTKQIRDFRSMMALLTGKNSKLLEEKK